MKNCLAYFLTLSVSCVFISNSLGQDVFSDTFVPRIDALIARDLGDLGEITCTYLSNGKKLYSITATIGEPYALVKLRKNGTGWDSIRNPDYYAAVNMSPKQSYSLTHLIKETDDNWSTILERRKLPLFAMIMTGRSTIPNLARSGKYSVVHKNLDSGDEFTLTSSDESNAYSEIVLEFDSRYDFPVKRVEYFDKEKSNGSEYVVSRFEEFGDVFFPVAIDVARFSGGNKATMTIATTFDPEKRLNADQCVLEAYNIDKPEFELANQRNSQLRTLVVTLLVLVVVSGGVWYFYRALGR